MTRLLIALLFSIPAFSQGRQVVLNWTASVTPNVTYNAYRAAGTCSANSTFAKVNTAPIAGVTFSNVVAVGTYCYHVTAEASGLESAPSNNVEAVVPPLAPSGLTINVTVAVNVDVNGVQVASRNLSVSVPEAQ